MKSIKNILCLVLIASLSSCASVHYSDLAKNSPGKTTLNEGYSLLAYLMKDESNVDKVLWIKSASPGTTEVIQAISKTARETKDSLAELSLQKPILNLKTRGLPDVEAETRDAIAKATAKTLLGSSGKAFEMRLLLTQVQATNYAAYLCQTLAASDKNSERSAFFGKTSDKFLKLREQVVKQISDL